MARDTEVRAEFYRADADRRIADSMRDLDGQRIHGHQDRTVHLLAAIGQALLALNDGIDELRIDLGNALNELTIELGSK